MVKKNKLTPTDLSLMYKNETGESIKRELRYETRNKIVKFANWLQDNYLKLINNDN